MSKKLWEASKARKKNSNLYRYENFLSKKYSYEVSQNYSKILKWSIGFVSLCYITLADDQQMIAVHI